MVRPWLLLLWMVLVGQATARDYLVEFHTDPSGARVYLEVSEGTDRPGEFLGLTGTQVRVPESLLRGRGAVSFLFELDGYQPGRARLTTGELEQGVYPPAGSILLEPGTPTVRTVRFLRQNLAWIALAGLVVALGVVMRLQRARQERLLTRRHDILERFQARADTTDPHVMSVLGGYRLVEVLGKGATATVYRAIPDQDLDTRRQVAIKVLAPRVEAPEQLARFHRESRVYRELRHPNIILLHDVGEQGGLHYIVMELVQGKTLRTLAREGLSRETIFHCLLQVLQGLHFAHQRGVLHRDIKPDNVMVDESGRARVMDFGLAHVEESASLSKSGTIVGTPAYMAPEVIREQDLDGRCDQYSVGVLAFELLTGRRPFEGSDGSTMMFKHLTEEPVDIRSLCPDLSDDVAEVLMRMIRKDREERFPDLGEAGEALRHAIEPPAPGSGAA
ncbi:MAG: serine/threonine-protein kinase [Candidatus Eremiobacterota bacterium]